MIDSKEIINKLNEFLPNAKCELEYNKDYELLIAAVLSAQCTDKRVNIVAKELFSKHDIFAISKMNIEEIERIIRPIGTFHRKAIYIKEIANSLVNNYNGGVPNNRKYLENLKGVGRKVCNVVLAELYNEPCFAVDTHVYRVSKRLGITKPNDNVTKTENKLMSYFPKDNWNKLHHQLVIFGRYTCKSIKPQCEKCPFKGKCNY